MFCFIHIYYQVFDVLRVLLFFWEKFTFQLSITRLGQ